MGPINLPSQGNKHILVCVDYITKWCEVLAMKQAKEDWVVEFLYNHIMQPFGAPIFLVKYQGPQFMSNVIEHFTNLYQIRHRKSSPYHPQSNGKVEVTNKKLEAIMIKTMGYE